MTRCVRKDCSGDGVIDEEGLCTECGRPAEQQAASGTPTAAGTPPQGGAPSQSLVSRLPPAPGPAPLWAAAPWAVSGAAPATGGAADTAAATATATTNTTANTTATAGRPVALSSGQSTTRSARGRLGAGLVQVPPVPRRDPEAAVLEHAELPASQRLCGNPACRAEVGRSKRSQAGALKGFCPKCRTPFSFEPALKQDDLVGQYKVRGPIAHGGQGWIYLARDVNLDGDPVVLKGLLSTGDAESYNAFVTERRFLIEVKHPAIVQIRNFVQRPDPEAGGSAGYIVMEYVDGKTLRQVLQEQRAAGAAALPVPQAIAFALEILSAFAYLHDAGLLFCDLKPDNVMQVEDRLKLIDLGAVRRVGDTASSVWASPGYAAPEIDKGLSYPSVGTDLFTVGRTLAVLTTHAAATAPLPGPEQAAVLREYESYYRFLRRATDPDPAARFSSADEMAEQLTGVLRQVLAADGDPRPPVASARFTPERAVASTDVYARLDSLAAALALPEPREDRDDPAVGFLATLDSAEPARAVAQLAAAPLASPEVTLRLIRAHLACRDITAAQQALDTTGLAGGAGGVAAGDWRLVWHRGLVALAGNRPADAGREFLSVFDAAPGEIAPQLALAACAELAGQPRLARHYYEAVWRTDPSGVGAAFGIARTLLADDTLAPPARRAQAVAVLESVSGTLHHHVAAWTEALRLRLDRGDLTAEGLREAADRLRSIPLDEQGRRRLRTELLEAARDWLDVGHGPADPAAPLDGVALTSGSIRRALAESYLAQARLAHSRRERAALVDRANRTRPRTLF